MFNHSTKHRKQQLNIQPTTQLNIQINWCSTIQLNTGNCFLCLAEWLKISLVVCSGDLLAVCLAVVSCV
jgi:hypothetical protein